MHKFPRRERLTRRSEYLKVYEAGKKQVDQAFICYVHAQLGHGRQFGMAVSRKVGGAVVRNRVKRYLREIYRRHRGQLSSDLCTVVIARPASARLTFHECETALWRLLQRGGAIGE
ncbi:MAG: ribonuclease P protein component [Candidatus Hydrogenedentes bacterium]|nr:ribonuclease P protein component [Candidatus Hydrogenedentota bacterium]